MNELIALSKKQRRSIFADTSFELRLTEIAVEKDFWVCWALNKLFGLQRWGEHFAFKGGTSLSKCWNLIERFSEDVDIVIERAALGFGGDNDPDRAPSRKQLGKRLKELEKSCQESISNEIYPKLNAAIYSDLGDAFKWNLELDSDRQTLLLTYPSIYSQNITPLHRAVKIEMGARSDTEPTETIEIRPYICETFPDMFGNFGTNVRAVMPKRTFWEKAMLLHEETFRPEDKKFNQKGKARHYFDLYHLIQAGIGKEASQDLDLFNRIVAHRQKFFRYSWVDYSTMEYGRLRLVPAKKDRESWKSDYNRMRGNMFYGDTPTFEDVLKVVEEFQVKLNTGKSNS